MPDAENVVDDEESGRDDPARLEESVRARREILLGDVRELERVVRSKLDLKKRLRQEKQRALVRAEYLMERVARQAREKPVPFIVAGAAILLFLLRPRRKHWRLVLE